MTIEAEFISYAKPYDLYDGQKDWSELSTAQQDAIIKAELSDSDINPEDIIMQSGLIKKQAQGLRAIFVAISMAYERAGLIKNTSDWSEPQRDMIIEFLKDTDLGIRIKETFTPSLADTRQPIVGRSLEPFSEPYAMDKTLKMDMGEIKRFIYSCLYEGSQPPKKPNLSHEKFAEDFRNGKIAFYVDRGKALSVAAAGLPMGNTAFIFTLIFNASLIGCIPVGIFVSWKYGIALALMAIAAKKVTTHLIVQRVRQAALNDARLYEALRNQNIIWHEERTP